MTVLSGCLRVGGWKPTTRLANCFAGGWLMSQWAPPGGHPNSSGYGHFKFPHLTLPG